MAFLKEYAEMQRQRILPQKGFWKIAIVTVAVVLLIAVFNVPERYYIIYDGAVDNETGVSI